MAYKNLLHPPISASQYSPHTSLGGALSEPSHAFQSHYRRWLPQPSYAPASKWRTATATSNQHMPAISFDYPGFQAQGIPMRELSSANPAVLTQRLHGANDFVFPLTGLQKIALRIMWPGYTHIDWARTIEVSSGSHITRAQLAILIATNVARYMETVRLERPTVLEYAIGSAPIQFEHVVLVGLHNVFEDVWQAGIAIDRR